MDKKILTFLIILLALLAVAFVLYNFKQNVNDIESFKQSLNEYKETLKKMENKSYYYEGKIKIENPKINTSYNVYVKKVKDDFEIAENHTYYVYYFVRKNNKSYECIYFTKKVCKPYHQGLNLSYYLLSEKEKERFFLLWGVMIEGKAINVKKEKNNTYVITFSYKNLSVEKLKKLGYVPSMPIAKLARVDRNITFKDGLIVKDTLFVPEINHYESFELSKIKENINEEIVVENINESEYEEQYNTLKLFLSEFNKNNDEVSLRAIAIHYKKPEICLELTKPFECVEAYSAFNKDPNVCMLLEKQQKDRCLLSYSERFKENICGKIEDKNLREQCEGLISNNTTQGK